MGDYLFGAALSGQTVWFLGSAVVGAAAMLLYTLVRVFTRGLPKGSVAVALGDILFFVLLAALEFVFLFLLPQNALRWFHILGQVLGGALFWLTLAPFCFKLFLWFKKTMGCFCEKVFVFTANKKPTDPAEKAEEEK